MPDAAWAVSCVPQAYPEDGSAPVLTSSNRISTFCSGSLALASLNRACRNLVPTFPRRSPPSLLTTAACGGLRSAPDCRPRRTYLHLSYSYASPCGPALLVTQDPSATLAVHCGNGFDADFSPYQSTLEPIQCCPLSLGADMRRREFITLLSGAAAPAAARATTAATLDASDWVPQRHTVGTVRAPRRCVPPRPEGNGLRRGSQLGDRIPLGGRSLRSVA